MIPKLPKEEAQELVDNYYSKIEVLEFKDAKECALIAVDEFIRYFSEEGFMMAYPEIAISEVEYWQEVKKEIENL